MFFAFAGATVIYFITATFFLPETKGKTLEEIESHFSRASKEAGLDRGFWPMWPNLVGRICSRPLIAISVHGRIRAVMRMKIPSTTTSPKKLGEAMTKSGSQSVASAFQRINARIEAARRLARRDAFPPPSFDKQADPEVVEEVKWIKPTNPLGAAVWSHDGLICTGEIYKNIVKMTFAKGASLDDP